MELGLVGGLHLMKYMNEKRFLAGMSHFRSVKPDK